MCLHIKILRNIETRNINDNAQLSAHDDDHPE